MMIRLAITESSTGRITGFVSCDSSMASLQGALGETLIEVGPEVREATHWRDGETIALRPVPIAPPAMTVGVMTDWNDLSVGTTVRVIDPETDLEAGSGLVDETGVVSLTLPAGPWRLVVDEHFPSVSKSFDVEVLEE